MKTYIISKELNSDSKTAVKDATPSALAAGCTMIAYGIPPRYQDTIKESDLPHVIDAPPRDIPEEIPDSKQELLEMVLELKAKVEALPVEEIAPDKEV